MPENYGWVITRDYLAEEDGADMPSDVGLMGPGDSSEKVQAALKEAQTQPGGKKPGSGKLPDGMHWFRMFDDDRILYYEGILLGDADDEEEGFSPLDNYGAPGAGCVRIDYYADGKWETL
jgi:hypothetical protein